MADLIDRQSILDIVMCYCPDDDGSCSKADVDIRELLDEIENLPAANRFIPCSERLPEQEGKYLCSLYYSIPPYHLLQPENDTYIRDVSIQHFDGKSFKASVVAWMPMPDAYEPPESEVRKDDER